MVGSERSLGRSWYRRVRTTGVGQASPVGCPRQPGVHGEHTPDHSVEHPVDSGPLCGAVPTNMRAAAADLDVAVGNGRGVVSAKESGACDDLPPVGSCDGGRSCPPGIPCAPMATSTGPPVHGNYPCRWNSPARSSPNRLRRHAQRFITRSTRIPEVLKSYTNS